MTLRSAGGHAAGAFLAAVVVLLVVSLQPAALAQATRPAATWADRADAGECRRLVEVALHDTDYFRRRDHWRDVLRLTGGNAATPGLTIEGWRWRGLAAIHLALMDTCREVYDALEVAALHVPSDADTVRLSVALRAHLRAAARAADRASRPRAESAPAWAVVLQAAPDARVVPDPDLRARIAAVGSPWRVRERCTGIELTLVPSGRFTRGASGDDAEARAEERPAHAVVLTRPYYIGTYEVTNAEFRAFDPTHLPRMHPANVFPNHDRQPATHLCLTEIDAFCAGFGFRLPSQAEWEYACRAGTPTPRYGSLRDVAWTLGDTVNAPACVGLKAANGFGLYDMLGNVWECTGDAGRKDDYERCKDGAVNPTTGGMVGERIYCGGAWGEEAKASRASSFQRTSHGIGGALHGFRVVHDVDGAP